jgi:carboxypeptidase C (cathepsin A)
VLVWRMAMLTTSVSRLSYTSDHVSLTCSGNWFGGEAISLAMEYTHSDEFRAAGYTPMMVDGTEYGEVRQYGNFSFARVYEAGHEIPYYQRKSSCYLCPHQSGQTTCFANLTFSCCRVGILQPYSVPLRYRDWRGEGHCQLDILWPC